VSGQKNMAGRAVVTFGRGWQTLVAVRSLGRRGVEVITGDEYPLTAAAMSRYSVADFRYPNPTKKPEAFLDALERTVINNKPKDDTIPYVLIPIHKETYLIAEHRDRFEPHIRVPVPQIEHILQVHNKGTLAAYAMERGLPIPRTWMPRDREHFQSIASEIKLPSFVKLRESASGVGIRKVDTLEELQSTFTEFIEYFKLKEKDYPIIQQGVGGDDYCVTTLFDHGKLGHLLLRGHAVELDANSVLAESLGVERLEKVVSLHGQVVGELGNGVRIAATGPGEVVEAIEADTAGGKGWIVGIQWHPEMTFDTQVQHQVFQSLVDRARERREGR